MTDLTLLLNDDFELKKNYAIPTIERTVDYITVKLEAGSDLASHISDYDFALIIELPSGAKARYTLTPSNDTEFERFAIPKAFSRFGSNTKIYITVYNGGALIGKSSELPYELQNFCKSKSTLTITENGIYDVSNYEKAVVNAGSDDTATEMIKGIIRRSLISLNIPDGITSIGEYAFYSYTNLQEVIFPDSVSSLGDHAFQGCRGITNFSIPSSITSLGYYSLADIGNTTLTVPNTVTSIGGFAFAQCQRLTTVYLEHGLQTLPREMFWYCIALKNITIPNSITSIHPNNMFGGCSALENVVLETGFNANKLNLSASTRYTAETIVSWLEALADRTEETVYTLTIGSTNLAKLTAEEIAIATNKNWNLA